MAKARALDKRRKSITNIRKITRTMELVSTAQFRRAMERAVAVDSYTKRLVRLVGDLVASGLATDAPLLEPREKKERAVLLILTANRGMCGGYNSGVLRAALARLTQLQEQFQNVELYVSGSRGLSYLKYRKFQIDQFYGQFDHKPTFDDVNLIANQFLTRYAKGEIDRLEVAYAKFVSISKQYPTVEPLLPLADMTKPAEEQQAEHCPALGYEFLPSPQDVLEEIVPNAFRLKLFKTFLDAAVCEQIARMMAMKAATDNADQMISLLTTEYNRARQSQITNEIIEVVSGASAVQ
ncbi:MAG: ATP synthase F1 subunit gamma [Planctomycetia bacterium]|nr:ATP synthase F1 subunit gamma [Planctomycetia bacterium]